jgi:hypothetical protein
MTEKMPDHITDGPRHPDEDAEMLTHKEEERIAELSKEYLEALEREDNDRLQEIREAITEITTVRLDEGGFWI